MIVVVGTQATVVVIKHAAIIELSSLFILFPLMWAVYFSPFCTITVVAKHLVSGRVVLLFKPCIEIPPAVDIKYFTLSRA